MYERAAVDGFQGERQLARVVLAQSGRARDRNVDVIEAEASDQLRLVVAAGFAVRTQIDHACDAALSGERKVLGRRASGGRDIGTRLAGIRKFGQQPGNGYGK